MDQVIAQAREQAGQTSTPASNPTTSGPATANAPAKAKVGVVEFNNKAKASVSTDSLRQQLIAVLNGNGIDAVALNASSASEAALEAKAKGCAYILYTDISTLKTASSGKKLGGFSGKASGVSSGDSGSRSETGLPAGGG
jgi:predicted secreted protein